MWTSSPLSLFAHRGVVLVFIAVPLLLCGQWPRRAEICGNVSQLQFLVDVVGKHWSRTVEQTAAASWWYAARLVWVARNGEGPAEETEVSERGFKLTLAIVGYAAAVGQWERYVRFGVVHTGDLHMRQFRFAGAARFDFDIQLGMGICGHDTSHQFGERLLVHVEEHSVNGWRDCV